MLDHPRSGSRGRAAVLAVRPRSPGIDPPASRKGTGAFVGAGASSALPTQRPTSPLLAGRRSPPRPLLDELFGFPTTTKHRPRHHGDSPFDESSSVNANGTGPPKTIFAAPQRHLQPHGTPSSLEEDSSVRAAKYQLRRARNDMGRFSPAPAPRVPSTEDSSSSSTYSTSSNPSGSTPRSTSDRRSSDHDAARHHHHRHRRQSQGRPRSTSHPPRRRRSRSLPPKAAVNTRRRSSSRRREGGGASSSHRSSSGSTFATGHASSSHRSVAVTEDAVRGCVRGSFLVGRHVASCWGAALDAVHDERSIGTGNEKSRVLRGQAVPPPHRLPHDGTDHSGHATSATSPHHSADESEHHDDDQHYYYDDDDDHHHHDDEAGDEPPYRDGNVASVGFGDVVVDAAAAAAATVPEPPEIMRPAKPRRPRSPDAKAMESPSAMVAAGTAWCLNRGTANDPLDRGSPSPTGSDLPGPGSLRDVRLALFQEDFDRDGADRVVAEDQYLQALKELQVQSAAAQDAQLAADRATKALEEAHRQLQGAASEADQRHTAATASSEKLLRDRLEAEERLRVEQRHRELLASRLTEVQAEADGLRSLLQAERLAAAKAVVAKHLAAKKPPAAGVAAWASSVTATTSTDVASAVSVVTPAQMVLQAEVVRLRAELAEAHAARLSAERSQSEASEQLKAKEVAAAALRSLLSDLERQAEDLRVRTDKALMDRQSDARKFDTDLREVRAALEASQDECRALSGKANRTAKELSDAQAEVLELRVALEKAQQERDAAARERDLLGRAASAEAQSLRDRVRELTERVQKADATVLSQAADHVVERRRFLDELSQARIAARCISDNAAAGSAASTSAAPSGAGSGSDVSTSVSAGPSSMPHLLSRLVNRNTVMNDVAELLQRSKALQQSSVAPA